MLLIEKQGRKNRQKRVIQATKEGNVAALASETFVWLKHPHLQNLYCQCVEFVTIFIQHGRFIEEKDRIEFDLQLFICFSQIVSPSSPHHTPFLIHQNKAFRKVVTDAVLSCCFVVYVGECVISRNLFLLVNYHQLQHLFNRC